MCVKERTKEQRGNWMDGDERRVSSSGVDRVDLEIANSVEDTEGGKKERKGVRLEINSG